MATSQQNGKASQNQLPLEGAKNEHLNISSLETWLWDAACAIRGTNDAPKFKDFILPLVFYKRLSDVFDDEFASHVEEFGSEELAREILEADHKDALKEGRKPIVRFYIPSDYRWSSLRNHPADGTLGEFVTDAMREVARLNPDLQGVLDVKDYNERQSGERTLDDSRLAKLIEVISRHRLGLANAEPDILGRAYEYLLRKFAEGQGQSAGEFYTPKEVGFLMARLLDPAPYTTVYDPTCGSGGLLIKARLVYEEHHPDKKSQAPKLHGQELNSVTFAMAKMNMFLHDYTDSRFAIGDTFLKPGFAAQGAGLKRFDYIVANPMWNQDNYDEAIYDNDAWNRFEFGTPPKSSADWGWMQHIHSSLSGSGRAAIVLDTNAVSRGSGNKSREKDIRKEFVDRDFIEAVILLPENLFYNTSAPGIVILLNKCKPENRRNSILLVNASTYYAKRKPKNVLANEGVDEICKIYQNWIEVSEFSRIISIKEAQDNDYNLSPSQFITVSDKTVYRPYDEILTDLYSVAIERKRSDAMLKSILNKLGMKVEGDL